MADALLPGTQYFETGSVLQKNLAFGGYNVSVKLKLENVPPPQAGVTFYCLYRITDSGGPTVFQGGFPVASANQLTFPWFNGTLAGTLLQYLARWSNLNGQIETQLSEPYEANYTPNVADIAAPSLPTPAGAGITSGYKQLAPSVN